MKKVAEDPKDPKKPYCSPRLLVYGDLWRLTMGNKRGVASDGTGLPATKA